MTRSRKSARKAGSWFERQVADHLADEWDDRIDRKVKTGSKDQGDIANFRVGGRKVAVECKDVATLDLSGWVREAQKEAENLGAIASIVVHKRRGHGAIADQYVTTTLGEILAILRVSQGGGSVAL